MVNGDCMLDKWALKSVGSTGSRRILVIRKPNSYAGSIPAQTRDILAGGYP